MEKETRQDIIEMGRGYLGVILMAVLMATGSVSAMYAGESMTFQTNLTNPVYTVTGNTSDLTGLNVSFDNGNITIDTNPLMASDNFTMLFFDNLTKEVEKIIYRGGGSSGGSRTKYVDRNVTVYVPEYINQTNEVEVLNEVEKIVEVETGYKLWHIVGALVVGMLTMFAVMALLTNKEDEEEDEE